MDQFLVGRKKECSLCDWFLRSKPKLPKESLSKSKIRSNLACQVVSLLKSCIFAKFLQFEKSLPTPRQPFPRWAFMFSKTYAK